MWGLKKSKIKKIDQEFPNNFFEYLVWKFWEIQKIENFKTFGLFRMKFLQISIFEKRV